MIWRWLGNLSLSIGGLALAVENHLHVHSAALVACACIFIPLSVVLWGLSWRYS